MTLAAHRRQFRVAFAPRRLGAVLGPAALVAGVTGTVTVGVAAGVRSLAAQEARGAPVLRTEQLAPNLYRISGGPAGSVMVLTGDDGLLLVDTQDSTTAPQLDSAIAAISSRPVRLIINTHYHDDHINGNARWRARGAVTLAHANVAIQARKDTVIAEWDNWTRKAASPLAIPMVGFADSVVLRMNGEEILVYHPDPAHTDGDAVVWFRHANVVHTGDVVELGAYPFIDWWVGGSLDGMVAAVDQLTGLGDARTRFAPGHGPITDRVGLAAYRGMLTTVRDRVGRALSVGKSRDEVVASRPTREFDTRHGGERAAAIFTALVYAGLKRRTP